MLRFLLAFLILESRLLAQGWDHSVSILARSHAAALALAPAVGYGQLLWGDRSGFQYGYIRPNLSLFATPTSYGAKPALDFYPISILGVSVARNWSQRFINPKGYDCDFAECQGPLNSTDISAKLLLGYGAFFLSAQRSWVRFDSVHGQRPLLDAGIAALLRRSGEKSEQWTGILGGKWENWTAGLMHMSIALSDDRRAQISQYAFVRSDMKAIGFPSFSATVALGRFESALKANAVSAVGILTYTGAPSIALGN